MFLGLRSKNLCGCSMWSTENPAERLKDHNRTAEGHFTARMARETGLGRRTHLESE